MSAIAGIWRFDGPLDLRPTAERMSNGLAMFGPDRNGLWEAPDQKLMLVWRQFNLLPEDIHDRQPLRSADGVHTLVADARIDNIDEFIGELDLPKGSGIPDAAIIMAAYRKWGSACLDRMVGEFAFAVWNSRESALFLARDAMGCRPIFWARGRGFFAFATMPRGLFALPEVSRAIDERNLACQIALIPPAGDGTLYRDIHRIPPGYCLTVTQTGQDFKRYWELRPKPRDRFRNPQESAEALRETYTAAVRSRLRSNGGIGSMISAGWDSSSVTCIAARLLAASGRRMTSFTAVPRDGFAGPTLDGRLADESQLAARILSDFPNVDHVRVSSATRSHLTEIEVQSSFQDMPVSGAVNMVWINRIAAEAKRRGIRVLLDGSNGNMTTSYNGFGLLPHLFRQGRWLALSLLIFRLSREHRVRWCLHRAIGPFLPPALYRFVLGAAGRAPSFDVFRDTALSPEFAKSVNIEALAAERNWRTDRPWPDGREMRLAMIRRTDQGYLRAAMNARFGIDSRDPTIDRRVVELCLAIPEEHFLRDGRESAVFRDAVAGVVPGWLLEHRWRGLQSADWYEGVVAARAELAEHVDRLAKSQLASRALDIAKLRSAVISLPDPATPPDELAQGDWGTLQAHRTHGAPLLRAMNMGHFILRTEGSNQ